MGDAAGHGEITHRLLQALEPLRFGPPVTHVYNPLAYARSMYDAYLRRYGGGPKEFLLLGMNPGPWGMAQTGVPFGEVGAVRDWLGLREAVGRPAREHPKRPVLGLDCPRSEVSGRRVWGWARERHGTPERFFRRFLVINYCPLAFLEETGRNRTPDKLPAAERTPLLSACDEALRATVELLGPRRVLGFGRFAAARAESALEGLPLQVGRVLHPSPANPRANRGWAEEMDRVMEGME